MPATDTLVATVKENTSAELAALDHALSHDVEGSIRGVGSLARILLQKHGSLLSSEAAEVARMIDYEAARSSRLVAGLLEWLHYGQRPLSFAWQDATAIAREACAMIQAASSPRLIDFDLQELPPLWTDHAALSKIFHELLGNAARFTAARPNAMITVSADACDGQPVITVQDNGVGFDMGHARHLFSLFRQLHRKQEFGGEGAGLAVVRRILERQGGRIWAEGVAGQGASFHFTLPPPAEPHPVAVPFEPSPV